MGLGAALWRLVLVCGMIAVTAAVLYAMGRPPICTCGVVKYWHAMPNDRETSQHLTDWYSVSHVLHGFIFYFVLWLITPFSSVWSRLAGAVFLECAWEIAENTDIVINRYRAATAALDYAGDSIVNSMGDIGAMVVGFLLAAFLPAWVPLILTLLMEATMAFAIRDNLTLNILMLVHPIDAIKAWQTGA